MRSMPVACLMKSHRTEIDEENEHHLVLGGGYEYLHTVQNGSKRIENRTIAEVTSRVHVGRVRLRDRNRGEFRWVNGVYDFSDTGTKP